MQKLVYTLAAVFTTGCATAQALEPIEQVNTVLYCYAPDAVVQQTQQYGEEPLFTGWAIVETDQGPIAGPVVFAVNQHTGSWSGLIISPTGLYCNLAVGVDFEPYNTRPRPRQ